MTFYTSCYHQQVGSDAPPDSLLQRYVTFVRPGRALDLGCGCGRNALFLARRGFHVTAVDIDSVALDACRTAAEEEALQVQTVREDLRLFPISSRSYTLILAVSCLQFFSSEEIKLTVQAIQQGLAVPGLAIVTVPTTEDPLYFYYRLKLPEIEPGTFYDPKRDTCIHFFGPGELRRLFNRVPLLFYREEEYIDLHGYPHVHARASLVAGIGVVKE